MAWRHEVTHTAAKGGPVLPGQMVEVGNRGPERVYLPRGGMCYQGEWLMPLDPLTVPEEPYATVDDRGPAVILWLMAAWIGGFVALALLVAFLVRR